MMAGTTDGNGALRSLRDELASLKIDRPDRVRATAPRPAPAPAPVAERAPAARPAPRRPRPNNGQDAQGGPLRQELESLRIERSGARPSTSSYQPTPPTRALRPARAPRPRGDGGLRLLSWALWMIPLGLLGGGGYYGFAQYQKIKPKPIVRTATVRELSLNEARTLLSAKGYLKSRYQAMIGARVPGRVEQMLVEEGTKVRGPRTDEQGREVPGDLLAVLEHNDLKAQKASRQASVTRSKADLEEARAELNLRQRKAERALRLQAANQLSVDEVDQAVFNRDMTAARVQALEAAIGLQQSMVEEVQASIDNMHIYAPFDGTVVVKAAEVGETITPGGMGAASGRGSVVTLANLDTLEVETDIAENMMGRIQLGQPAEISVSAVPDRRYQGKLRRVVPMGDRARGTLKVYVEITDPNDGRLFPELLATVSFLPETSDSDAGAKKGQLALFLPRGAVVETDGQAFVWTVDAQGQVHRTPVEVSVEGDRARVQSGVAAGATVVVDPPAELAENAPVKVED